MGRITQGTLNEDLEPRFEQPEAQGAVTPPISSLSPKSLPCGPGTPPSEFLSTLNNTGVLSPNTLLGELGTPPSEFLSTLNNTGVGGLMQTLPPPRSCVDSVDMCSSSYSPHPSMQIAQPLSVPGTPGSVKESVKSEVDLMGLQSSPFSSSPAVPRANSAKDVSFDFFPTVPLSAEALTPDDMEFLSRCPAVTQATQRRMYSDSSSSSSDLIGFGAQNKAAKSDVTPPLLRTAWEPDGRPKTSVLPHQHPTVSILAQQSALATHYPRAVAERSMHSAMDIYERQVGEHTGDRPRALVEDAELQDHQKSRIFVLHEHAITPITWYQDTMEKREIQSMILCACDAMANEGVLLREVFDISDDSKLIADLKAHGEAEVGGQLLYYGVEHEDRVFIKKRVFAFEDFHMLEDGHTYLLERGAHRPDLAAVVGDRWRRLTVPVEPLLHAEAQRAITRMHRGSNLLKHTRYGFPHLRQFQLSTDCQRLVWYSGKKRTTACVRVRDIHSVRVNSDSQKLKKYKIAVLTHLSFGVAYGNPEQTLDLTAKDEDEFDYWVCGLKALVLAARGELASKVDLLNHSLRFAKAMEAENAGVVFDRLPAAREQLKLADCVDLPLHSLEDIDTKCSRLKRLHQTLGAQVQCAVLVPPEPKETDAGELPEDFAFADADADFHMEAQRMRELVSVAGETLADAAMHISEARSLREDRVRSKIKETRRSLQRSDLGPLSELFTRARVPADEPGHLEKTKLKLSNQLLWQAEVDLENVTDMLSRLTSCQREGGVMASLASTIETFWRSEKSEPRKNDLPPANRFLRALASVGEESWKDWKRQRPAPAEAAKPVNLLD